MPTQVKQHYEQYPYFAVIRDYMHIYFSKNQEKNKIKVKVI